MVKLLSYWAHSWFAGAFCIGEWGEIALHPVYFLPDGDTFQFSDDFSRCFALHILTFAEYFYLHLPLGRHIINKWPNGVFSRSLNCLLHFLHHFCPSPASIFQSSSLIYWLVCKWPLSDSASSMIISIVGFTRIAVNFKFHSWFANFKLT